MGDNFPYDYYNDNDNDNDDDNDDDIKKLLEWAKDNLICNGNNSMYNYNNLYFKLVRMDHSCNYYPYWEWFSNIDWKKICDEQCIEINHIVIDIVNNIVNTYDEKSDEEKSDESYDRYDCRESNNIWDHCWDNDDGIEWDRQAIRDDEDRRGCD